VFFSLLIFDKKRSVTKYKATTFAQSFLYLLE